MKFVFTTVMAFSYTVLLIAQCPAPGTTSIEVTNTNNAGVGSLRQAINCANSDPALDTITFNIPGVGPHTIFPTSTYNVTSNDVVIDGSLPNGRMTINGMNISGAFYITGSNCQILRFIFKSTGGSNPVPLHINGPNTVVGLPSKGNVFVDCNNAILISANGDDAIIRSNYFGCDTNYVPLSLGGYAITAGDNASGVIVGGDQPEHANIFANMDGVTFGGNNWQIIGNYFGTDPSETITFSNSGFGVRIQGNNALISDNVFRNFTIPSNDNAGIFCLSGSNNTITNNVIRNNLHGVRILGGGPHHVTDNSIFCNTTAGITLAGGNNNMAAPVITSASPDLISGTTVANATVEVFTHDNAGCSGNPPCQGKTLVGTATANGSGAWSLNGPFNPPLQTGNQVTATATSANHTSPFSSCATVVCTHPDKEALKDLYEATNGPGWINTWDTTTCDVCNWYGVTCNGNGRVVCIDMDGGSNCGWDQFGSGNGLIGTIPNLNMSELDVLNLSHNDITGNIPNFSGLPKLGGLFLTHMPLTGSIPNFSNIPNLSNLFLGNTDVSGGMPSFSLIPNIRLLLVGNNPQLGGSIPNLSNRPNLVTVHMYNNNLTGGIANITNSPLLAGLELYGNQLTGPIPAFNLPNLEILYLDNNQLSGNLPNLTLPNLQAIRFNNNNLEGCFPASYAAFCNKTYNFSNNPLLPWEGDFSQFCANQPQIGAPCTNSATPGPDEIQTDCSCDLSCPVYTASLSGTTTICRGNSTDISFNFSDGTAPYNVSWTGGTLNGIADGHTEMVSPTVTTTYSISSATDANGCTATPGGSVTITVIDVVNLGAITGSNTVCVNQSTNYSVTPIAGVTTYNWTAPGGATITAGQGTPNITVDWNGSASGDLCVEAVNDCGTGTPSCRAITVTPLPAAPAAISGATEVCTGIAQPYSIDAVPDATSYTWTVPSGALILSGQGTISASIRWNNAITGDVCVRAQNTCGNSSNTCLSVTSVAVPTVPVFLAGNFSPCETATLDYGVTPQAAFNDYQWTYSNGGNISAGQGTPNITVDWLGAGDGQLCVTASSDLCNTDRTACRNVTVRLLPPAPTYLSFEDLLCVGDTGVYVLQPIAGATSYNWTANGGQFIGSSTGSTVKIKWPDAQLTTIEVRASNICGDGPITYDPTVLVSEPVPPGISGALSFCTGGSTVLDAGAGYTAYKWSNGPATRSITVNAAGVYTVTVTANNGCKSSASVTVTSGAALSPNITGPGSFCGSGAVLDAGSGYTAFSWAGPNNFSANTQQITASTGGIYTVTVSNASGCTGTDTHTLVNEGSTPPTCQSALTQPLPNSSNIPVSTALQWSATPGCVEGYRLSLGTTPGGTELLNAVNVGNVTNYQPATALPAGKTIYVRVLPYNTAGAASGCGEFSFATSGGGTSGNGPGLPAGDCWTWQNPQPQGNRLNDGFFVDTQTGWTVGEGGTILKTINGGINWATQTSGTTNVLNGTYFVNAQIGWVVGEAGLVLKTINGGSTWTKQNSNAFNDLKDVYFIDAQTGWAVGMDGTILKTINGGTNWIIQPSGSIKFLYGVYFVNAQTGWVVGWDGTILKTADGGASWVPQTFSGTSYDLHSVHFIDAQTGWVAGESGFILKTTNGGTNWIEQTLGTSGDLFSVHFVDAQTGWAVGQFGSMLKTSNGGTNWTKQSLGTFNNFYCVHFADAQTGWLVGGSVLKTSNGGIDWVPQTVGAIERLYDVYFVGTQTGWAVGTNGSILKTINGGTDWTTQNSGTAHGLTSVHFVDAQTGWVVGWNNVILKTTNGGTNWIAQNSGTNRQFYGVHFVNAQTGWVVGSQGTILKTINGGNTWVAQTSGITNDLNKVFFINTQTGWIVGWGGTILKTLDGGSNWTNQNSGINTVLKNLHFIDAQTGWVVGPYVIKKTVNGGNSWTDQIPGTTKWLESIYFTDAQMGWVVGEGGTILKTLDGGNNWTKQNISTTNYLYGVHFSDAQNGWIAGEYGTILRHTPIPTCLPSIPLHNQTNVPTDTKITWPNAPGCEDAYRLSLGTTPGGSDLLNNQIVADTAYQPAQPLPAGKTIYVRVVPYNGVGEASGCQEFSFVTAGNNLCNTVTTTLNGGPGSLREAIACAAANPGPDTIRFVIPGAGPHIINMTNELYAAADTGGLVIDATTQPGWQPGQIVVDGSGTAQANNGLFLFEDYKGLDIYGLTFRYAPSAMFAFAHCHNLKLGAPGKGNIFYANERGVPAPPITQPEQYSPHVQLFGCTNATVQANVFGRTETNTRPATDMVWGLTASGENIQIGGSRAAGEGNVFAHALFAGLGLWADAGVPLVAKNIRVFGNHFGTDASGVQDWGNENAINFGTNAANSLMQQVQIGGGTADRANQIRNNSAAVTEYGTANKQVTFRRNMMVCNDLGIDLCCNPTRPLAIATAQTLQISGTAQPNDTIEVYISQTSNCPAAACQGSVWLGQTTANATGQWLLAAPFAVALSAGDMVTAIGTGNGQTGEFSNCVMVTANPCGVPKPGDSCLSAPLLCQGLHGYCNTLGGENMPAPFPGCPSFLLSDPSWIAFIAGSTEISLRVTPSNCIASGGNNGMQGGIYASCIAQPIDLQCPCTTNPFTLTATNFVVGQKYYMVLDGCAGSVCDYSIEVLKGLTTAPLCVDTLLTPGHQVTQVPVNTKLTWPAAPGKDCVSAYRLSLGTTPGGSDILNNLVVADTTYQPVQSLPAGDTVFVRIVPFSSFGEAGGCEEFWFVMADEVILDTIPPCIVWQKVLGGTLNESGSAVVPTQDGGYIVAGGAFSKDGDVSGNHGGSDAWVIKLDSVGSIQWKRAYGGTQDEEAFDIEATPDGGYIFTGYTMSKDGDLSKNQGGRDVWVVKTDATGNIQWQKTYGGGADEAASSITTTSDGGYLVAGHTLSSNGDVSGHHGAYDGWVFKLDQFGNLQWQRPLGGSSNDYINSPQITPDGEYILAGFTLSNNGDVTGNHGGGDAWMIKLTSNGVLTWQKAFGGSGFDDFQSILVNTDGTYVAAGFSSSNDGDVLGNHGDRDVWMVKTSATGQLLWQHCFGGTLIDAASEIQHTSDQGYIISAGTASTNGNVTGHHGATDAWVIKTTSSGKLQWQKCLGGTGQENAHHVVQHTDGVYSMVGYTDSNDGDVSGNHGLGDLWVVKLGQINASAGPDTTLCPSSPLTLTASGGTAYQWSDGGPAKAQWTLTPTVTKTYTVTVTAADGCTAVDSVKVTVQNDLNCGLVAHYNFDGNVRDTSGKNNHGVLNGAYYWNKDRFGNCQRALHLNGFSQKGWVRVPNSNSLKFNAKKEMTLSLWVELDTLAGMGGLGNFVANGNHALVAKGGDNLATPNGFYYILNSNGKDLSVSGQSSGAGAPTNMAIGNISIQPNYVAKSWKHIALVISPDSIKVYLGETLVHKAISKTNFAHADNQDLLIGIFNAISGIPRWYPLQGSLDDLRIYNRALSPAEITELYALPNENPSPPPAAMATNAGKSILCAGETTTLNASPTQAGYTYAWYRDSVLITGATGSSYKAALAGKYQVRISEGLGCDSLSAPVQISNGSPDAIAIGDTLTCVKTVVVLKGQSTKQGVSYAWTGPNGFTSGQQNPPVNVAGDYILTVKDPANGCSARDTVIVAAANGLPSAVIGTPNGLLLSCMTDSVRLVAPSGTNYTYKWAGNSTSAQITVKTAGVFTLTVTDTGNGCTATSAVTVDKNTSKPDAAATGGELPCKNPFVILNGLSSTPGATYSWVGPNNFAVNQQNPPVSVAGTYTLTVRNPANGCSSTAMAVVDPPKLPVANIASPNGQNLTCDLTSLTLQASGGDTYNWSGTLGNQQSATANQPGPYTVTVTTTSNGCTATASLSVGQDISQPGASAVGGTINCLQTVVVMQGNSNIANASYTWTGPNSFSITQQNPVVNVTGTYTLTTRNPANGCTSTASALVIPDNAPPVAAISAPNGSEINCLKTSVLLQVPTVTGHTYRWQGPGGLVTGAATQTYNLPGVYTVTVTNPQNGCSATSSITVSNDTQKPDITAVGGTLNCGPSAFVTLQGNSSTSGVSYAWAGPNNFSTTQQNPVVNVTGTYTLTVRNPANVCTSTMTTSVTNAALPPAAIALPNGLQINCKYNSLPAQASGGDTYAWSGALGNQASASISQSGTYTVTVTSAATQCSATATVSISQSKAPPTAFANSETLTCLKKTVTLSGSTSTSGVLGYAWSGPGGFAASTQQANTGAPGFYTLTVTGPNFCTATATTTVNGSPDLPKPTTTGGDVSCLAPAILTANSDIPGSNFLWAGPGGAFYSGAQISVNVAGIYTVTVTSSPGCTSTATVVAADKLDKPAITAAGGSLGCISKSLQLQSSSAVANASYQWSGPANFSSTQQNPVVSTAGDYTLTVRDPANGCTNTKTITVTPEKQAQPVISGLFSFCEGSSTILSGSAGFDVYEWSNGQKTDKIEVISPGIYILKVTDAAGCTGTQSVTVVRHPAPKALLLLSENSGTPGDNVVCAGSEIGLSAGGGNSYLFTQNGIPIGSFQAQNTQIVKVTQNAIFGVLVRDDKGCTDSTTLAEPPGNRSIAVQVLVSPNLEGATLSSINECPGKPTRVLLNLPNCPDATYSVVYQINGQSALTTSVPVVNRLGVLDLGIQAVGTVVCNVLSVRTAGTDCAANFPSGKALTIPVLPVPAAILDTTVCYSQPFVLNGIPYPAGKHKIVLKNSSGCDSILNLNLSVVTTFKKTIVASFCKDDYYLFEGDTLRTGGTFTKVKNGPFDCKTEIILQLTQTFPVQTTVVKTICPGSSFALGDSIFTKKGFYVVPFKSASGCDSMVQLRLDVQPLDLSFAQPVLNACEGSTLKITPVIKGCPSCKYKWDGGGVTESIFVSVTGQKTHTLTITDANNCKLSASVQVNAQPAYDLEQEALLCLGDTIRAGALSITKAGQYLLDLKSQFGCDSMITLNVKPFDNQQIEARRDTLLLAPQSSTGEIELAKNDTKTPAYSIGLIEKQGPKHGKATLSDKDKLTYTLNSTSFSGVDSLRYVLCPELGCPEACDSAWLIVLVQAGSLEEAMKTMPNFISPEPEDGQNDVFEPLRHLVLRGIIVQSSELLILNRWGEVVHRSEDGRWDGRLNGQLAPPATYYYRLILQTGEQRVVQGALNVVR